MRPLSPAHAVAPRDPAPSRAAYRMQRLWLTPVFRALFRVGLPTFVLTFSVGLYLSDADRRQAMVTVWGGVWDKVEERPEFLVTLVAIDGASPALADAIRAKLALPLPMSSFDIDLEASRLRIEELDAIADAEIRMRGAGILQVQIIERQPAVVWRTGAGLSLLDAEGMRIATIMERGDRSDLPLIAGQGANRVVPEAMAILAAAQPILPRLRGLVRVGERRWDLVLDRDQRILLPETGAVLALERVIALDQAEKLLDRDVIAVDLRNEHRPVLRLAPPALSALREARGLESGASDL
jgi:cell division protein FtsQ